MSVGDGEGVLVAGKCETGGSRGDRECGPNFDCLPNRHTLSDSLASRNIYRLLHLLLFFLGDNLFEAPNTYCDYACWTNTDVMQQ